MGSSHILTVKADIISIILSFIIHDLDDFYTFGKFLMAYFTKQSKHKTKEVLEKLDWDSLYQYHQHQFEVTRDRFKGFISFAVRNDVTQAMFYDSVHMLFLGENVQHHLLVLSSLSGNHFPSSFSFIFFKAIYRTFERDQTVEEMSQLLSLKYMRIKLVEIFNLLQDIYNSISEKDYLLPVYKFCPNARNTDPIYQLEGPPFEEELWYSLCNATAEGNYREEGEIFGKPLTMQLIWESECAHCRVQLILYKILLNAAKY